MKSLYKFFLAFFFLIVVFADEIFLAILSFYEIPLVSGLKSVEAIIIAVIAYLMMAFDVVYGNFTKRNVYQLLGLLAIIILYLITGTRYSIPSHEYQAQLLSFGSFSVSACYLGMKLSNIKFFKEINKLLPVILCILAFFIGMRVNMYVEEDTIIRNDETGLGYQSASYFLSFIYSYCIYYLLFSKNSTTSLYQKFVNCLVVFTMFYSAIYSIYGGGRGSFIFIVFISTFLLFFLLKEHKEDRFKLFLSVIVFFTVFLILASHLNLWESAGFNRVYDSLFDDEVRTQLQINALEVFKASPFFGKGLGSIWWTVGYYSHNMVIDLLAESGIIGTALILYIILHMLIKLYRYSKSYSECMFILIIFLGALVESMFSGYWYSMHKLFLAYGFVMSLPSAKKL